MISLKKIVGKFKGCQIYPGHGESSTIDYEIKNNSYLKSLFLSSNKNYD